MAAKLFQEMEKVRADQDRHAFLRSLDVLVLPSLWPENLPIVMLDSNLRIRRFNPGAQRTLNLIASDVGRPIHDLKMTLELDELDQMISSVIDNLEVREQEVTDRRGRKYSLRIRPYKTTDNKIEGAVLVSRLWPRHLPDVRDDCPTCAAP